MSKRLRQLDSARRNLGILIRELGNRQHLLLAEEQALGTVPRDLRFSQISSIEDQGRNLRELLHTAADIQRLVEDLIRRSELLKSGELACGIGEMITKLYAQSHNQEVVIAGGPPVYKSLAPGQFNATPEAATFAVFVALQAYTALRKRRSTAAA